MFSNQIAEDGSESIIMFILS